MTEEEWLAATDPRPMLDAVRGTASGRKLRLVACAWCRLGWPAPSDPRSARAVATAERFADGAATDAQLERAGREAGRVTVERNQVLLTAGRPGAGPAWRVAQARLREAEACQAVTHQAGYDAAWRLAGLSGPAVPKARKADRSGLARDAFGPLPFRPVTCDPAWRTATTVALAEAIYAGRAFDRLPILADALEEAGCDNADVLAHCRGDGPHARGCWVVDMVLGKA